MKIIFLDIDGVLNTPDTKYFDDFRVLLLKEICDQTGAQVVLTASKRYFWNTDDFSLVKDAPEHIIEANEVFKKYGIKIYGITGECENHCRQDEIYEWLRNHPEVESYVIIDDETTWLMDFVGNKLIKTSILPDGELMMNGYDSTGILPEHVPMAVKILNKK